MNESAITLCCKQLEGSESERRACCCRRNRPNESTIGRAEAAESDCGEAACCSPQHASALLLSELSNGLRARSDAVSHFATSMSIQVAASPTADAIRRLYQCPDLTPSLQGHPDSEKCLLCEIEVKPICKSMELWILAVSPPSF